jgi:hypothetical protein
MELKMNAIKELMKNCKHCGEEFRSNNKRRTYCSDECFENFQRDRRRRYSQDNKEAIYKRRTTCKYCGNKFKMKELRERCCGGEECQKEKKKEKQTIAWKKHYNKNIKKTTNKFKKQDAENSRNYRRSHKEQLNKRKQARHRDMRDWLDNIKKERKCSKCREDKFYILDFHHLDPNEKEINISRAASCGYGRKRIQAEIDKCIVLCRNCHGELHYMQDNIEDWQPSEEWLNNKEIYK